VSNSSAFFAYSIASFKFPKWYADIDIKSYGSAPQANSSHR
jgi:hypothetical protein